MIHNYDIMTMFTKEDVDNFSSKNEGENSLWTAFFNNIHDKEFNRALISALILHLDVVLTNTFDDEKKEIDLAATILKMHGDPFNKYQQVFFRKMNEQLVTINDTLLVIYIGTKKLIELKEIEKQTKILESASERNNENVPRAVQEKEYKGIIN